MIQGIYKLNCTLMLFDKRHAENKELLPRCCIYTPHNAYIAKTCTDIQKRVQKNTPVCYDIIRCKKGLPFG